LTLSIKRANNYREAMLMQMANSKMKKFKVRLSFWIRIDNHS
jgi:hypothetical protein